MMFSVADLAFHQRLGLLIDKLGEDELWPALARTLREVAQFDTWVVMLFQRAQAPLVLAGHGASLDATEAFSDYRRRFYQIDPFHSFSQGEVMARAYRLDEVAPDSFRESEYFRQYFAHHVGEDEVQFLLPIKGRGVLSLSLGNRRRFVDQEIGAFQLFTPWLLPLMKQGLRLDTPLQQSLAQAAPDRETRIEDALRQLGAPHLTEREVQVAVLVLCGHSTKAVARQLGIALETVKVHRRNLYAKLEVSNQAGLFLRFSNPEPSRV
jgi:DNA-binding CsgD family transcriptional regulator